MSTNAAFQSIVPEEPISQIHLRCAAPVEMEEEHPADDEPLSGVLEIPTRMPSRAEIVAYMPIVESEVARFLRRLPRSVLRDDLVSAGTMGLLDALRRNTGARDARFDTYVRIRVRGAICDELRREDWLSRGDRAKERANETSGGMLHLEDLSEGGHEAASGDESPIEATERHLRWEAVTSAVRALPERERKIIELYFFSGWMAKDIARELGVSEPRVSQLQAQAVSRLRNLLAAWQEGDAGALEAEVPPPPASVRRLAACLAFPRANDDDAAEVNGLARLSG